MALITDRTLSCVDEFLQTASDEAASESTFDIAPLRMFFELLVKTDVETIELSERVYDLLCPLPDGVNFALRIKNPTNADKYPDVKQFICRNAPESSNVRTEIALNDTRDAYTIARYSDYERIRIQGLDDVMLGDYAAAFKRIRDKFSGDLELCPTNRLDLAAATAAEWAVANPSTAIVTSFGGIGGFVPTEELVMILRLQRLRKVTKNYEFFPEMADAFQTLVKRSFRGNKPIIGKRIFYVESGIHVDGIAKQPKCYEPFAPEIVGQKRRIVIGKQSGAASVRLKLSELGLKRDEKFVLPILERVKQLSTEKNGSLTNGEFAEVVRGIK
jgi:homocitrate synthase NifV